MLTAYADAAPDLVSTAENATRISHTIVDEQQNLDEFLVSTIGLADLGNDVIGGNRQALTDVVHLLVPTTDLHEPLPHALWCGLGGLVPFCPRTALPSRVFWCRPASPLASNAIVIHKTCRRSPPRAARSAWACPNCRPNSLPPIIVSDVGANPMKYGNRGILLNSDALKQWLFGPIPGPPRNTAQIGHAGMRAHDEHARQVHDLRCRDAGADRVPVLHLRAVENRCDQRVFGGFRRRVATESGRHRPGGGHPGGHRRDVSLRRTVRSW